MNAQFRHTPIYLVLMHAFVSTALAQQVPSDTATVTVTAEGKSRQVQDVSKDDLIKVVPGSSPLKTLEKMPGVSFQSADPFGAYEWSTRFSARGFNQNHMGFTLDEVPLGDMSYGNNNGLHISRAISSENIGRVTLSQGSGDVGTASTSNLGGTVQFYSSVPADVFTLSGAQTIGSNRTSRTFARLDTGLFGTGSKADLSVTRQRAEKWKGTGAQNQDQFNSKFVQQLGTDHKLTAFFNYSDRKEIDYQDVSLDMIKRLGNNWDNYAPDWQRAVNAARGIFTGGVNSLDDAYYQGSGLRRDSLLGATLNSNFGNMVDLKTTVYHHSDEGQGHWYTPYTASTNGVPIAIRTSEYGISRNGVLSDLTLELTGHTVNAGFWVESSLHSLTRNFYNASGPQDTNVFLSNPTSTGFKQNFATKTTQFYAQDTMSFADNKLKLNYGFKSPHVTVDAISIVGTRAAGQIKADKSFLPQIGINYALSKNNELFASVSQNMRAFQPGVDGPFSQTQASFNLSSANLKPETSTTFDSGYRFKTADLVGSVALYFTKFNDRLLSIAPPCAGIQGCPSLFANVGEVDSKGAEAALSWTPVKNWTWFNSATYNDAQYKSNYIDNNVMVNIAGKQVVDAPKFMLKTELSYDTNSWFARTGAKFTDKRFYTYTNDAQVPSYVLVSLSTGYKQASLGGLKDVSIQLNVENLLNKNYISTIGSNGFSAKDPTGTAQTLLTGAPRQFFITFSAKI